MAKFNIRPEILITFYNTVICSVWRYCLICWGGNVSKSELSRIDSIIRKSGKVLEEFQPDVLPIYQIIIKSKLEIIFEDAAHPLHKLIFDNKMISGRLRLPYTKTNRHRNSFVPRAISTFNDNFTR